MKQFSNTLIIDTRNNKNVKATIVTSKEKFEAKSGSSNSRPDSIILLIDKVLKKGNLKIEDIDEIKVEEGPGSYTGLKVGVSVANALSFALQKSVNGRSLSEVIEPKYE